MAKKEYTLNINSLEEVAFLRALLITRSCAIIQDLAGDTRGRFERHFPGGIEAAKNLSVPLEYEYEQLKAILRDEGIDQDTAPWLKPQAPTEIYGNAIDYCGEDGIRFGCSNQYELSLDQMREMVKKCEGAE